MKALVLALVLVLVGGGLWLVSARNDLVGQEEDVRAAWSQVQNAYQRRMDLIPNLVETVKGAAGFERGTYTDVAQARARAGQVQVSADLFNDPQAFQRFEQAQQELSSSLSRLLVTVERYPELKANESFRDLLAQLEGTENRISVERRRYNEAVTRFNKSVRQFPRALAASLFHFESKPYFEAEPGAQEAPPVRF